MWFALNAWLHYFMLDVVNLNIEFAHAFFCLYQPYLAFTIVL